MDPLSLLVILLYAAGIAKASKDPSPVASVMSPQGSSEEKVTLGTVEVGSILRSASEPKASGHGDSS